MCSTSVGRMEREQISDIRPPKKSNIRYQTPQKIKYQISRIRKNQISGFKKSDIRYQTPQKNQLSDITSPKKSKYQISTYPRSTPHLFYCPSTSICTVVYATHQILRIFYFLEMMHVKCLFYYFSHFWSNANHFQQYLFSILLK